MKNQEKILEKIRRAEEELAFADPKRAAKLATHIVRWKSTVFDKR